jgi:hypothetical protein
MVDRRKIRDAVEDRPNLSGWRHRAVPAIVIPVRDNVARPSSQARLRLKPLVDPGGSRT